MLENTGGAWQPKMDNPEKLET